MKNKFTAIILILIIITQIAACGTKEAMNQQKEKQQVKSDGPVRLTVYLAENDGTLPYRNNFEVIQDIEKKTNVHINFSTVSSADYEKKFIIAASAGRTPDIMVGSRDIINSLGESGYFLELNDLIQNDAPNVKAFLKSDADYIKMVETPKGKIYTIPKQPSSNVDCVNVIRRDWLNKLKLQVPSSVDEMIDVLKAFRNKDPNGNRKQDEIPFSVRSGSTEYLMRAFADPFGVPDSYTSPKFILKNGKIIYPSIEPEFKGVLTLLNKLYTEKLIDPDFATIKVNDFDKKVSTNKIGVTHYKLDWAVSQNKTMKDIIPNFKWQVIKPLKGSSANAYTYDGNLKLLSDGSAGITLKCKDPDAAMRFFDFLFSREGSMLESYGIKGKSYTVQNGLPKLTDAVLKNPRYKNKESALFDLGANLNLPYKVDIDYQQAVSLSDEENTDRNLYNDCIGTDMSYLYFSNNNREYINNKMKDINAYKNAMVIDFITGKISLSRYDEYINKIKGMGIQKVLDLYNEAYEDYQKKQVP